MSIDCVTTFHQRLSASEFDRGESLRLAMKALKVKLDLARKRDTLMVNMTPIQN